MVLVNLTKAEIRRILTDLHRPFIYEIKELKRPEALLWKKLEQKLEKALHQKILLGGLGATLTGEQNPPGPTLAKPSVRR